MKIENSFGNVLREARKLKEMTQGELGKLLGYSGMTISHFEKGTRPIKDSDVARLNSILKLNSTSSTTLFRASDYADSTSSRDRALKAFDKLVAEKYDKS